MPADVRSLGRRVASSAIAFGAVDVATRALSVVLSVVTARALNPWEVGALGIAVTLIAIMSTIGSFWETAAVVESGPASNEAYAGAAAAARLATVGGLVLALHWALPTLTRALTASPEGAGLVATIARLLLWTLVAEAMACFPRVVLQRQLQLRPLVVVQLVSVLTFVAGAVMGLELGFRAHAVAWAQLTSAALGAGLTWLALPALRVAWPPSMVWRSLTVGTVRLFAGGFVSFLGTRTDNLLVASAIGEAGVSYYGMAYTASRLPTNVVERITSQALMPAIARVRGDREQVDRLAHAGLSAFYLAALPVSTAVLVLAPALVEVLLGPRWLPLVPCLRVMCLTALLAPCLYAAGAVVVAFGRGHWVGLPALAVILFQVVAIPPAASRWGPVGAGFVDLGSVLVATYGMMLAASRAAGSVRWRVGAALRVPALGALAAGGLGLAAGFAPLGSQARFATQLAVVLFVFAAVVVPSGGGRRVRRLLDLLRSRE